MSCGMGQCLSGLRLQRFILFKKKKKKSDEYVFRSLYGNTVDIVERQSTRSYTTIVNIFGLITGSLWYCKFICTCI